MLVESLATLGSGLRAEGQLNGSSGVYVHLIFR